MRPLQKTLVALSFLVGFAPALSIAAANAAWVVFCAVWIAGLLRQEETFAPSFTPMDRPVVACLLVWLAAALLGMDPIASVGKAAGQLRFVLFYLLLWASSGRYAKTALTGYLWGAGAAVFYGLGQYALWNYVYPNAYVDGFPAWFERLGWQGQHYAGLHGDRYWLAVHRVHGSVHPLTYAELIMPAFLFFAAFYVSAENIKQRLAWLAALTVTSVALLLSQSRGPWLGAALGLGVIGLFHRRRLWLLIPVIFMAAFLAFHPAMRQRAASFAEKNKDISRGIRLDLWKSGLYIFKHNPWHGVGPGMIGRASFYYRQDPAFPKCNNRFAGDMHNLYLQHLCAKGIFGLFALVWLMATPLWMSWKVLRSPGEDKTRALALGFVSFFAAFFVVNLTERAFDDAEVQLLFWVLTAAAVHLSRQKTEIIPTR